MANQNVQFNMKCTQADIDLFDELKEMLGKKSRGAALKIFLREALPLFIEKLRRENLDYKPWKVSGRGTFLENLTYNGLLKLDQELKEADKPETIVERLHKLII